MKIFSNIREAFWPLLEEGEPYESRELSASDITVTEANLDRTLEVALKDFSSEEDRGKTIDSKSSLFISTISVITSIVIAVTTVLVKESNFTLPVFGLVFLLFLLTIYMARTIWFSIKVLERRAYQTINVDDYLEPEEGNEYTKKLIVKVVNITRSNYKVINTKVDYMTMAQEYFKRALIVVIIYSFLLLLFFITKSNFDLTPCINYINMISISGWNILLIYVLLTASIVLSLRSFYKTKSSKK